MTQEQVQSEPFQIPAETYARLAAASPAERARIVLQLIQMHPEGRLELPARDGQHAVLDGVDLSRIARADGAEAAASGSPGWDAENGRLVLKGADIRGASLRKSNLRGVDLSHANLQGAFLGGADLAGARLDGANLAQADLAGANLDHASLGEADLRGAMLEEADLQNAVLRFTRLEAAVLEDADLRKADLWGANLEGADLSEADLRGAGLVEAKCGGVDLTGAFLQDAVLKHADLRQARLVRTDLRGADLAGTNLEGAVLKDAYLQDVDLSQSVLLHVHLSGARLDGTRFQQSQLGTKIGEELAGSFEEARKGYLVLERSFAELGDPDAASWAYRRRRRMQKHETLRLARSARDQRHWTEAGGFYARYAGDELVERMCDYGESIPRVLGTLGVLYLTFTLLYAVTGSVVREEEGPAGVSRVTTRNPIDLAIFSLLAMTTGSIGIRLLPQHDLALVLVGVHVFLGVALIGLLGFVLGNRIRR